MKQIENRVPEKSEMFDAHDARTYIAGCDFPQTSDYIIVAAEITHVFGLRGRLSGQIVETCPGPGNLCGELLRKGARKVIGIDGDQIMIDHATQKFQAEIADGRMQFLRAPVQELPLPDKTVHGIVNMNSFHQFGSELRALEALQEMVRVIKPGGWGFVRDFKRGASQEAINQRLEHTKPEIAPLLLDSLQAAFTCDEFIDLLKLIPGIRFSVTDAEDPRRLSKSVQTSITNDPVTHWIDFVISQNVQINKLKQ